MSVSSKSLLSKLFISGVITPFSGLISQDSAYSNFLFSSAVATSCAEPVYAKLFKIETDGSLNENAPLATQLIGADARYSFDLKAQGLEQLAPTVQFVVKAEGCNGDVYKRAITNNDSLQNIDARTTVVAEVVNANSLVINTLNQADRQSLESLVNTVSGTTPIMAITSLTTDSTNIDKFTQIFGVSPTAIQDAKPEVSLIQPQLYLNELQPSTYSLQTFHIDPGYSFAYAWKLDGVVKSSSSSWTYIPTANDQGTHQIDFYVGKNNGSGSIDTTKPFYLKTILVSVNNNMLPTPPNWSLHPGNPTPMTSNTVLVNMATGVSLANCASFSHLAITDTPMAPGVVQFNIDCANSGTQTESVTFSSTDGDKTLYLWAMDNEGSISTPKTINLVLDTLPPVVNLTFSPSALPGGTTHTISLNGSDTGAGLSSLELYFSSNGGTSYSLLSNLSHSATSYNWSVPAINTSNAILKLVATDLVNLATTVYSAPFAIDSIVPTSPVISRTSSAITQLNIVAISVTCSADYHKILFSQTATTPLLSDANWEDCTATKNFTTNTGDGLKTIYAFTKDAAGNISTSSNVTMTLDTTLPTLSLTNFNTSGFHQGGTSQNITWSASDVNIETLPISISFSVDGLTYTDLATSIANSGTSSWTLPSINNTTVTLKMSAIDKAGNVKTIVSNNFTIDSSLPSVNAMTITNNVMTISNRNILVSLTASDSFTKVSHLCFKVNNTTPPALNDTCWVDINNIAGLSRALNISVTDFPLQLGTITGTYTVTGFVRDEADHISSVSNSGNGTNGVDLLTLNYTANPAPIVSNVLAVNVDAPSIPTPPAEQVAPLNSTVFIQWYATDNTALPANAIKIQYTTDDSVFHDVASNLTNSSNGSCTVHAGYSGCYKWANSSPTSSFLRFKIIANDGDNNSSSVSNPMNTNSVNFLAGNTNHGIGGSAVSAVFTSYNEDIYIDYYDDRQFVVTKNGFAFVRSSLDDSILYIDPISGAVNYLLKKTGADTGDGGSVFSGTLKGKAALGLDHQDNLLIFSDDKIRKVDLHSTPWKITTLIGGGATVSSSTNPTLTPSSVNLSGTSPGISTPNGRLYFFNGRNISYYNYSDNLVHFVSTFNGLGATGVTGEDTLFDVTYCGVKERAIGFNISTSVLDKVISRFHQGTDPKCGNRISTTSAAVANLDPVTGTSTSPHPPSANWASDVFSSLNGQIYALWHGRTLIKKYDKSTNDWVTILGTGNPGRCVDGTPALSCNGLFMSAFVNSFGTLYVMDMGVVRYVDADGKIQTLFGQRKDFGVGYSPLSSRFSLLNSFVLNGNDIYVLNNNERKITNFSMNGGNVNHIAGNSSAGTPPVGSVATTNPLSDTCGWNNSCMLQFDSLNNRLYLSRTSGTLAYVDLNTGLWQQNIISGSGVSANLLGINPAESTFFGYRGLSSTPYIASATFLLYDSVDLTGTRIYGPPSDTGTPPANTRICWDSTTTTQLDTCDGLASNLSVTQSNGLLTRAPFDAHDSTWKVSTRNTNKIYSIPASGSTTFTLYATTTSSALLSFDVVNDGMNPIVYYCGTNGRLYKKNVTSGVEVNLPLPLTSMTCAGSSMYYHPGRNSLIFSYKQNLLFGIAEYRNP